MATQIEAARQLVLNARPVCVMPASRAARRRRWPSSSRSEMAEKVCSDAIQVHGGYGYLADYGVEQIYRDVRVCQIYEGTSDVQRMVISRALAA